MAIKHQKAFPVLLFPCSVETRFVERGSDFDLWIRIMPDEAFIQGHDPRLSVEEVEDIKEYKTIIGDDKDIKFWNKLVANYGAYRAAYLFDCARLPKVKAQRTNDEEQPIFFNHLPLRFKIYVYYEFNDFKGVPKLIKSETKEIKERERLLVFEEDKEGRNWVENFEAAIDVGLGVKIPEFQKKVGGSINTKGFKITKLVVTGVRKEKETATVKLGELFNNHKFTEGLAFIDHGTPTNNLAGEKSEFSSKDEFDASKSFTELGITNKVDSTTEIGFIPQGEILKNLSTSAQILKKAFSDKDFKFIETDPDKNTEIDPDKDTENDVVLDLRYIKNQSKSNIHDQIIKIYRKLSWFATGGLTIRMLLGDQLSPETEEKLWQHYYNHVSAKGHFPTLKIGDLPYGILPVVLDESTDPFHKELRNILDKLRGKWMENLSNVQYVGDKDSNEGDLANMLSFHPHSLKYKPVLFEYPKISGAYTTSDNKIANVKESLRGLKPRQVLDLVKKDLDKNPRMDSQIKSKFLGEIKRNENSFYSPILSFGSNKDFDLLTDDDLFSKIGKGVDKDKNEIEIDDWKEVLNVIQQIRGNESLPHFIGSTSLFIDLIFRGYKYATQLYHQVVYFEPTNEMVVGDQDITVRELPTVNNATMKIKGANGKVYEISSKIIRTPMPPDPEAPTPPQKPITPVSELKFYVEKDDTIHPGDRLFRVKSDKYDKFLNSYLNDLEDLANYFIALPTEDRKKLEIEALREVMDLNSYRLDAWITSLAAKRLEEVRNVNPDGIFLGVYGFVENIVPSSTPVIEVDPEKPGDPKRYEDKNERYSGGIIHAPSSAQSLAATLYKNSFMSYQPVEGQSVAAQIANPYALNLTSDRIQRSQMFMSGIRQGQQIEALLGYQLERYIHENGDTDDVIEIATLREKYPLKVNIVNRGYEPAVGFKELSVIDGLKIIKDKPNASKSDVIQKGISRLIDTLDSSTDALFFEAGYQVTQGNLTAASAAMDAAAGKIEPPELESLKTKIPGVGINHKLIMLFPPKDDISLNLTLTTDENGCNRDYKAFLEPSIERWLKCQLGPMDNIGCVVTLSDDQRHNVTLDQLKISYTDLLYLSDSEVSEGAGELEMRIIHQVPSFDEKLKYTITKVAPKGKLPLFEALEYCRYAMSMLANARPLKTEDLSSHDEEFFNGSKCKEKLASLAKGLNELNKKIDDWQLQLTPTNLKSLAHLNLTEAKRAFLNSTEVNVENLAKEINKKRKLFEKEMAEFEAVKNYFFPDEEGISHIAFGHLHEAAKVWLGPQYILLPPAFTSDRFNAIIAEGEDGQKKLIGEGGGATKQQEVFGQERVQQWVAGLAQVKKGAEKLEEWQFFNEMWKERVEEKPPVCKYTIIQGIGADTVNYPWVGLDKQEIETILEKQFSVEEIYAEIDLIDDTLKRFDEIPGSIYPSQSESVVIYADNCDFKKAKAQYGLVIEEFAEHIPNEQVPTGLSFHYNGPNNEAPQALILGVSNMLGGKRDWEETDMRDLVLETMELMKLRMINPWALSSDNVLVPMTPIVNIPTIN